MSESMGFSVRIFIPTGEPEGLRVIEKSNWTGQGLFFPRTRYSEASRREELKRTGVYLLWDIGESGQSRAYVGEGDSLRPRLDRHQKKKDFWTHAVAFTSKDENLNKAHVQYLESRLIQLAGEAKRCELDNENVPNPPSLSEPDKADAELFLADMLLCLPVLGVSFFKKTGEPASADQGPSPLAKESVPSSSGNRESTALFLRAKGIEAEGYEDAGGFVVRSGSQAVKDEAPGIRASRSDLRKKLVDQGVLEDRGSAFAFAQDWEFNSPSMAAGVLLGMSRNGRTAWQDRNGRSLKEIQEAALDS